MGDPLSDPRGLRLLSADLGEISSLAGSFHQLATQAQTAAAGLRGAENDATWTGPTADAFRSDLGRLPTYLDYAEASYREAADALDTYGAHLEPIQAQFRSLSAQLTDARWALDRGWGHARHMHDEAWGLERRCYYLLDEFDVIRAVACSRVFDAGARAPMHRWWQPLPAPAPGPVNDMPVAVAPLAPPALAALQSTQPSAEGPASVASGESSEKHAGRGKRRSKPTGGEARKKRVRRRKRGSARTSGGSREKHAGGGVGSGTETIGGGPPTKHTQPGTGSGTTTIGGGPPTKHPQPGTGSGTTTIGGGPPTKHPQPGTGSGTETIGGPPPPPKHPQPGTGSGTETIGGPPPEGALNTPVAVRWAARVAIALHGRLDSYLGSVPLAPTRPDTGPRHRHSGTRNR